MSEYGLKIKNYEAGSIYGVDIGSREKYDTKDAMLTNSLFLDFLMENGLEHNGKSTRDVICLNFRYGTRSYEEEIKYINSKIKSIKNDENKSDEEKTKLLNKWNFLKENAETNKKNFDGKSKDDIRRIFYENGVNIKYPIFARDKSIKGWDIKHYKMLYRTPGKAKKGSCMFIIDRLYDKAREFLYMGITLPEQNAPVVEIGAYSSLITSTIVDRIKIDPKQILIVKDVDSYFNTDVVSIEIDENKHCQAIERSNYKLKNTMFDGQALIDSSIFPKDANGYVLLRHHFCKMAAFNTNIQKFYQDKFGSRYSSATVTDMWGNKHKAKDIRLITTNNAIKWLKFNVTYEYWSEWVKKNGCLFGVVKTAHESKLGDVQRMSYQMVNALSEDIMENVMDKSVNYIEKLKTDDVVFLDYLRRNTNFSNDFDVLVALYEQNPEFGRSEYFRERRRNIIKAYVWNLKNGRVIQNADNLVIVGSPYAMLLHSVGDDLFSDPTFKQEEYAIQCWTSRFNNDEYLAEFRNPFNSRNNLGYLHNVHHEFFDRYFDFGELIIAVNMIGTDFQDKNNGSDQDSDSIYTTNQPNIVEHAKYCSINHHTIVNNIPMDTNHYDSSLATFAKIDSNLAASQTDIGESSNLAQLCLSYTYNFNDKKYDKFVCCLSVIAQAAIDSAKRAFDISISDEIKRIKKEMNVDKYKYPKFWTIIKSFDSPYAKHKFEKNKVNNELKCPMNILCNLKIKEIHPNTTTLPMNYFFNTNIEKGDRQVAKKVEKLIEKYSLELMNYNIEDCDNDDYLLLRDDFDELVYDIKGCVMPNKYAYVFSWLINRAFVVTGGAKRKEKETISKISKNKVILLKTLYEVNPEALLLCFSKAN